MAGDDGGWEGLVDVGTAVGGVRGPIAAPTVQLQMQCQSKWPQLRGVARNRFSRTMFTREDHTHPSGDLLCDMVLSTSGKPMPRAWWLHNVASMIHVALCIGPSQPPDVSTTSGAPPAQLSWMSEQ